MDTPALLTAWLVLAAVLIASGIGKLRHPEGTDEAFTALKVPDALNRAWIIRSHPWGEIALALLLLALPHPLSLVVAAVGLALFTAYLVLVWRVVASGEEASCNCFGATGSSTVDRWTLARNILLAVVALVVVVDAATGGSAVARMGTLGSGWWWVVALAVAAAVTYLIAREGTTEVAEEELAEPEEDYLRLPIPDVPVRLEEGGAEISLRDLAAERAQVILLLNPGCGPCTTISNKVAQWAGAVPEIDFRVLNPISHQNMREIKPIWEPYYVEEVGHQVGDVFGNPGRPSAILLGMDGLLAGGPAQGLTAVENLVADITEQITEAREANAEIERLNEQRAAEAERLEAERVAEEWAAAEAESAAEHDPATARSAGEPDPATARSAGEHDPATPRSAGAR